MFLTELSLATIVIWIVVAAIAGAVGQVIAGSRGGLLISIVLGFFGAIVGTWLAQQLNLPDILVVTINGESFPIVWTLIGATILAALFGAFTRSNRGRY